MSEPKKRKPTKAQVLKKARLFVAMNRDDDDWDGQVADEIVGPLLAIAEAEPKLREHLQNLAAEVKSFLAHLDKVMEGPSTAERGQRIASLANRLAMTCDKARYFGLGIDFRTDKPKKPA